MINTNIDQILQSIEKDHVPYYDYLIQNIDRLQTPSYRAAYKNYWGLYAALLSEDFCGVYFGQLQAGLRGGMPQIGALLKELYNTPTHKNGRKSLQFSFCSKLCHMVDRQTPIYDSRIRDFYFFTEPDRKLSLQQRVNGYVYFHDFLIDEYHRVLIEGLLSRSIQAFRQRYRPKHFTDIKVIDSLIWAFTNLSKSGGLSDRKIVYC
ncbi:MAG: hypothetical protein Q8O92_08070 [Candidatus Latescibacter sp.]|nr:hypothetical protein [Candidatus Latescibacter sp.]